MPDITITLTAQQAQRVQNAFATNEDPAPGIPVVKEFLIRQLRDRVLRKERATAEAALAPTPFDPT